MSCLTKVISPVSIASLKTVILLVYNQPTPLHLEDEYAFHSLILLVACKSYTHLNDKEPKLICSVVRFGMSTPINN